METTTVSLKEELLKEFDQLSLEQQKEAVILVKRLRNPLPPGIPGEVLLARMGTFKFEPGDLEEMARAIEEGCERIDWDGWDFPA
jgi:hypothetical protein